MYLMDFQAGGRIVFTRDEAIAALQMTRGTFLKAAARLQRRNMLCNPRHGFYVVVPPQFRSWQAPPPSWYIDDLMRHERRPYYVGLLKAAELHGASHQAVMEFQVVTDRQLPRIRAGRSWLSFHVRKDMASIGDGIVARNTETGTMRLSSPELTALDLVRYVHVVGGVDVVATALVDLGGAIDGDRLASLAGHFECACAQRLGYLLDWLGHADRAHALHDRLAAGAMSWTALEPSTATLSSEAPVERDKRWHVIVRRAPEVDT